MEKTRRKQMGMRMVAVVTCALLLLTGLCGYHAWQNQQTASVQISLNYLEATQGLFPNKTRFHSHLLISDAVLSDAIDALGLAEQWTVEELANALCLTPVDAGKQSTDNIAISTNYCLTLKTKGLDMGQHDAQEILQSICEASYQHFLLQYCENQAVLQIPDVLSEDDEPYLALEEMMLYARCLERYIHGKGAENEALARLEKRLEQWMTMDAQALWLEIVEQRAWRDQEGMQALLLEQNRENTLAEQRLLANQTAMQHIMQEYETENLTALTKASNDTMEMALWYRKKINDTTYVLSCMQETAGGQAILTDVREKLEALGQTLNDIANDLLQVDDGYMRENGQNKITFTAMHMPWWQQCALKSSFLETAICMGILAVLFPGKRKEGATNV